MLYLVTEATVTDIRDSEITQQISAKSYLNTHSLHTYITQTCRLWQQVTQRRFKVAAPSEAEQTHSHNQQQRL